jgi:NADH-quinone oxidoreductase E subunit
MPRLTAANEKRARDTIALYPKTRSALIPLLHLCQEQDGHLTVEAMEHVADLLELTPAEVVGTASFYDMLFREQVGTYLVSVCTNIACLINGGYELLEHAEERLGVGTGQTRTDGRFTLEEVECIAYCDKAPCLAVNWRFFGPLTNNAFDQLIEDLEADRLAADVPAHGTLCRVRREGGLRVSAEQVDKERRAMDAAIAERKAVADQVKARAEEAKAKEQEKTAAADKAAADKAAADKAAGDKAAADKDKEQEAKEAAADTGQAAQPEETGPHPDQGAEGEQATEQVEAATEGAGDAQKNEGRG